MKRKILEIHEGRYHIEAYKIDGDNNPYRVYKVWYDRGKHVKQLRKYADFGSCIWFLHQMINCGQEG